MLTVHYVLYSYIAMYDEFCLCQFEMLHCIGIKAIIIGNNVCDT